MSPVVLRVIACVALAAVLGSPCTAGTTQVVLFTGFGSGSGPETGMGLLNQYLATTAVPDYLGRVFQWTEREEAFAWVEQHAAERSTLVLIGHSFGGNSALQLANDYISPLTVDLTVQIDPVKNLFAGANDVLPSNVEVGLNYYQISTGFLEPQGEDFVAGATNINVELLFNDTSITHTSIDNDTRLYALIGQNVLANLNPATADFDGDGDVDGSDFLAWQRGGSPDALSAGDLELWQRQYGAELSPSAASVPEPTGIGLVIACACVAACRRRSAT